MSRIPVDRTMYLYHVTPMNNWMSIGLQGLLPDLSTGARSAVWLVSRHKIEWAARHVSEKTGLPVDELIVVRVRVRRSWLRRNKVRGAWYCCHKVSVGRIERICAYRGLRHMMARYGMKLRFLRNRSIGL